MTLRKALGMPVAAFITTTAFFSPLGCGQFWIQCPVCTHKRTGSKLVSCALDADVQPVAGHLVTPEPIRNVQRERRKYVYAGEKRLSLLDW